MHMYILCFQLRPFCDPNKHLLLSPTLSLHFPSISIHVIITPWRAIVKADL